jgi:hypothetical protein
MSLGAGQGTCTATTCAVGELGAGASTPVSAVVSFATPGDATVGATVGGTTFDPDAADDAAQAVVHVSARPDTRVPTIKLKVLKASRRTGKVRLRVSLDEPGSITLRIKQAKRRAKPGKRRTLRFTEARARIVTLKLTRAQRRAKRLIITATAVDLAGNRSTATRRVRLHR